MLRQLLLREALARRGAPASRPPAPSSRHCCSTSDGGTSDGFASLSFCDDLLGERGLGAVLERLLELRVHVGAELDERLEAARRPSRTRRRASGRTRSFRSLTRDVEVARLAAEVGARVLVAGTVDSDVELVARRSCRSSAASSSGSAWPAPSSSCTPCPPPSFTSLPSTASVKSIVTTSPFFAGRAGSGALSVACCWRSASSCSSTIVVGRPRPSGATSSKPSYFTSSISGRTSKRALYENASFASTLPASTARLADRRDVLLGERLRQRVVDDRVARRRRDLRPVEVREHVARRLARAEALDVRLLARALSRPCRPRSSRRRPGPRPRAPSRRARCAATCDLHGERGNHTSRRPASRHQATELPA